MTTIYFDLETGGVEDEPTISLAAVAVDDTFTELGSFNVRLKFDPAKCSAEALQLNHYDPELWKDAISTDKAVRWFSAFSKPFSTVEMISKRTGAPYRVAQLAGYNALTFDLPRLRQMYGSQFFPFSYQVRDIYQRAMFWFDENKPSDKPKDMKLKTLCEYFGIASDGAHDALADVRMTIALYRRMLP